VVYATTAWEIAIKSAWGDSTPPDDLVDAFDANAFETLAITAAHVLAAGQLPRHHDSVDRILVAQSRAEGLTLISAHRRVRL